MKILGTLLFASVLLTSCGNDQQEIAAKEAARLEDSITAAEAADAAHVRYQLEEALKVTERTRIADSVALAQAMEAMENY